MTNEEELEKIVSDLRPSEEVSGLDEDTIIENYVDTEFKEDLDACPTEEDRKKKRQYYIDYYKNQGKKFIEEQIAQIKAMFGRAKEGIANLRESISGLVGSAAVPAVITTGTATSTANPAYYALKAKQAKRTFLNILSTISEWLAMLCTAAILIHFVLPKEVLLVIESIAVVTSLIANIPG